VAIGGGEVEGSLVILILGVDVDGRVGQQVGDDGLAVHVGCPMQGGAILGIPAVYIHQRLEIYKCFHLIPLGCQVQHILACRCCTLVIGTAFA